MNTRTALKPHKSPSPKVRVVRFISGSWRRQKEVQDYLRHLEEVDRENRRMLGIANHDDIHGIIGDKS